MNEYPYEPPLDKLLALGDPRKTWRWATGNPDYVGTLGLTQQHMPALIDIARQWVTRQDWPTDKKDMTVYAPVHAWRALAQLHATQAIAPLLEMLGEMDKRGDQWHLEEFPDAFALIGPAAIDALAAYSTDAAHGTYARICAVHALERIARRHLDTRNQVVGLLTAELAKYERNDRDLNAFLISYLINLKATESAAMIERAFAAGNVNEMVCGRWEKARAKLGATA